MIQLGRCRRIVAKESVLQWFDKAKTTAKFLTREAEGKNKWYRAYIPKIMPHLGERLRNASNRSEEPQMVIVRGSSAMLTANGVLQKSPLLDTLFTKESLSISIALSVSS